MSIAIGGYNDPGASVVELNDGRRYALNYAYFPLYPYLIRVLTWPLSFLGLTPIATATLAGVIISCVGTLFALLGLVELAGDTLDSAGQLRAAFYLLAFPSSFFLLSVYSEGLFLALMLWSLAFLRREQWLLSGTLAFFAVLTRPAGVFLLVPMLWGLLSSIGSRNFLILTRWLNCVTLKRIAAVALPATAFLIWRYFNGEHFGVVGDEYFGSGVGTLASLQRAASGWGDAVNSLLGSEGSQAQVYYAMEFAIVALGIFSSFAMIRRYTGIALFSLAASFTTLIASAPQSQIRYALGTPTIFLFLATAGRNAAFDRAWTMLSVLMLGLLAALFAADMWVG